MKQIHWDIRPNQIVSYKVMTAILTEHGMTDADFQDFLAEYGSKDMYKSNDIRRFLGY